jgi:cold shock CspA family protein
MMEGSNEKMPVMISGTVTSFDAGRGYGYVAQGGGRELFADQLIRQRHDPHIFGFGARVVFEVVQGPRGPHVSSVRAF